MSSEKGTARPTREDIEAARAMLNTAVMSGRRETVADILASAELVTRYNRVLDYALDCLTAEQESEDVPQIEPPEDAKPAEPAPESDAAFLARHGVGEWVASDLDSGEHSRDWRSAWWAISTDGFLYLADASTCRLNPITPGDTTTPEGRAECDARLVAHLRAEGRT